MPNVASCTALMILEFSELNRLQKHWTLRTKFEVDESEGNSRIPPAITPDSGEIHFFTKNKSRPAGVPL